MRTIDVVTQALIIIGGINWLLVGVFQFDLVAALFGGQAAVLSRLVYILVGASAIWQAIRLPALVESSRVVGTPPRPPADTP
jgi:hypothetical protein